MRSSPELRYGLREENFEVALPPVLVGWMLSNVCDVIVEQLSVFVFYTSPRGWNMLLLAICSWKTSNFVRRDCVPHIPVCKLTACQNFQIGRGNDLMSINCSFH